MSTLPRLIAAPSEFRVGWLHNLAAAVLAWAISCRERAAQRRQLSRLDDRLLRDIGLTRCDVAAECGKWSWLA
jgi:uncharacterized protein YjiS (DUF1127 family)